MSAYCRVLHIHSDLMWGGVEQWLLQVARTIDRCRFRLDFFAARVGSAWQQAAVDLGLDIIPSPRPKCMWTYLKTLRNILRERHYDVVHCHFFDHGGIILREAARAGIAVRVAHSHIDIAPVIGRMPLWARAYVRGQHMLLQRYATRGVAASREAAQSMFGSRWQHDERWSVLHCGVDLASFGEAHARSAVREELGIPGDAVVLGNLGRFTSQKNHTFLLDVMQAVVRASPSARLLLIGEGPLESAVRAKALALGLSDRIVFAGSRSDIPRVMNAMDAFVFPSLHEGLGLALVEAQAAGLRCVVSDSVPREAVVLESLVSRVPLAAGAQTWAKIVLQSLQCPPQVARNGALQVVRSSPFNIEYSVRKLEALYDERR